MKIIATLVLCMLPLGCSTHASALAAGSSTASLPDAAACEAMTEDLFAWIAAHRACDVDADCAAEPNRGFIYDEGSDVTCWPIEQVTASDEGGFDARIADLQAARCRGPLDTCSALYPEPSCVDHVCGGGTI